MDSKASAHPDGSAMSKNVGDFHATMKKPSLILVIGASAVPGFKRPRTSFMMDDHTTLCVDMDIRSLCCPSVEYSSTQYHHNFQSELPA
jgi:hypothetical protein